MFCLYVYLYTTRVLGACLGQKKVLDPLELKLQAVVSHLDVSTGS